MPCQCGVNGSSGRWKSEFQVSQSEIQREIVPSKEISMFSKVISIRFDKWKVNKIYQSSWSSLILISNQKIWLTYSQTTSRKHLSVLVKKISHASVHGNLLFLFQFVQGLWSNIRWHTFTQLFCKITWTLPLRGHKRSLSRCEHRKVALDKNSRQVYVGSINQIRIWTNEKERNRAITSLWNAMK